MVQQVSRSLFKSIFKIKLLYIVILIILINAIVIGIQQKSIDASLNDIGNRLLLTTKVIDEISLKIIENQGITYENNSTLKNIWLYITVLFELITAIYTIYLYCYIFSRFYIHFVIGNTSEQTAGWISGVVMYILLELVALVISDGLKASNFIWISWYHFFKAIPFIIKPGIDIANSFNYNVTNGS